MKPDSDSTISRTPRTVQRRSFIWKAGAAVSATLASTAAIATAATSKGQTGEAQPSKQQLESLSMRLAMLEDANAIRELHHAFSRASNQRAYEDIVKLFADDAEVHFNGAVFVGRNRGVRRFYVEHFGGRHPEQTHEPVHLFQLQSNQEQDIVEVAPHRASATARFHCLVQVYTAIASNSPLVEMARLQGQGTLQWWENGRYENSYVKHNDAWKIQQSRYYSLERASPPA